jgi:D-xylose transport system substrate-binding protein
MFNLPKRLYQLVLLVILLAALTACGGGPPVTVGLAFPDLESERWKKEEALLTILLEEKGYEVISVVANQDARLQADQVDNLVSEGVKAIIIVPVDGDALVPAVERAIAENVKVLAYDRLIKSAKLSAYLSFDNREAGRLQARALLDALDIENRPAAKRQVRLARISAALTDHNTNLYRQGQDEIFASYEASRQLRLLVDEVIGSREQVSAQRLVEEIITDEEHGLDGVLVSNEALGLGVLQALQDAGLENAVLIAGQEITVTVTNQVAGGMLSLAIYRDTRDLPPFAVRVLDRLLKEQPLLDLERCTMADLTGDPAFDGTIFCILLPVKVLDQQNLFELVVRSGYQDYDDVYREIPDSLRPARP